MHSFCWFLCLPAAAHKFIMYLVAPHSAYTHGHTRTHAQRERVRERERERGTNIYRRRRRRTRRITRTRRTKTTTCHRVGHFHRPHILTNANQSHSQYFCLAGCHTIDKTMLTTERNKTNKTITTPKQSRR